MKKFSFILMAAALMAGSSAYATKGIEDGSKFGTDQDSIRCIENLSNYINNYKIKNYDLAYDCWKIVYDECPRANGRTLYSNGEFLVLTKMSKETDAAKRKELFDLLMETFDRRIQYFGNDKKYPTEWILGRKAIDYLTYSKDKNGMDVAFEWLEKSVSTLGKNADADVINSYFQGLTDKYKANPDAMGESYINTYVDLISKIDARITDLKADAKGEKSVPAFETALNNVNNLFATSGAADCAILDKVFGDKIEAAKENADELARIMRLYKRNKCTESDFYFKAAEYANTLNPTEEAASGCGRRAIANKDYDKALEFFTQAVSLADNDDDLYDDNFMVAYTQMLMKRYSEARANALKAAQYDKTKGAPYILIAQMYAQSKPFDDEILNKTVYWAAVDMLEKAKSVDPECAGTANQLISSYKKYYPTKAEVFQHNQLKVGESFRIGGWIGESVRCRD